MQNKCKTPIEYLTFIFYEKHFIVRKWTSGFFIFMWRYKVFLFLCGDIEPIPLICSANHQTDEKWNEQSVGFCLSSKILKCVFKVITETYYD